MTIKEFYSSIYQQPYLLLAGILIGLIYVGMKRQRISRSLFAYSVIILGASALDAWLTASEILFIGQLPTVLASIVPLFFVILGDFKFFYFQGTTRPYLTGLWALVVPLLTFGFIFPKLNPQVGAVALDMRILFLVYEVLFLGFASTWYFWQRKQNALWKIECPHSATWRHRVFLFTMGYYALWALSDVLILSQHAESMPIGWTTRTLANVLYYAGYIPFVIWSKPAATDAPLNQPHHPLMT